MFELPGGSVKYFVAIAFAATPVAAYAQDDAASAPDAAPTEEAAPAAAEAQTPAPAPAQPRASAPRKEPVRRDPEGITGITPFLEAISNGDAAYLAQDYDGAKAAYQQAITQDPQNPLGHYRLGAVHRAKEEFAEAQSTWETAKRFALGDETLKAKILFVLADLSERQRELPEATNRWNAYEVHSNGQPSAKTYPESAADRKKRIEEWKKLEEQCVAVKERIAKRLEEADEKSRKGRR